MESWSEKVKEILTQHNDRKKDIESILKNLLDPNKIGSRCCFELIETNKLIWNITIGAKTFTLSNEEILKGQEVQGKNEDGFYTVLEDEKKDLEETIKKIILKKIQ